MNASVRQGACRALVGAALVRAALVRAALLRAAIRLLVADDDCDPARGDPDCPGVCELVSCAVESCDLYCTFGFRSDDAGCAICACREWTGCSPAPPPGPGCTLDCPFGWAILDGETACACCQAACLPKECGPPPDPAPTTRCPDGRLLGIACQRAQSADGSGGETGRCDWQLQACSPYPCRGDFDCPTGWRCLNEPVDGWEPAEFDIACPTECRRECPEVSCGLHCPDGFVIDETGCARCECVRRDPVEDRCARSSGDPCRSDGECIQGGCVGEVCYNPAYSPGGISCECETPPAGAGCGCVQGRCAFFAVSP